MYSICSISCRLRIHERFRYLYTTLSIPYVVLYYLNRWMHALMRVKQRHASVALIRHTRRAIRLLLFQLLCIRYAICLFRRWTLMTYMKCI